MNNSFCIHQDCSLWRRRRQDGETYQICAGGKEPGLLKPTKDKESGGSLTQQNMDLADLTTNLINLLTDLIIKDYLINRLTVQLKPVIDQIIDHKLH